MDGYLRDGLPRDESLGDLPHVEDDQSDEASLSEGVNAQDELLEAHVGHVLALHHQHA